MMYLTDSRRQWIRPAHAGTTGVRTRVLPGEVPMMRHRRWRRCCPDSSRARAAIGDPGCRVRPQRSSPEPWWRMRVCRGAQTSASSSVAMLAGHRCPRVSQWFSALVRGTRRIVSGCGPLHVLRPGPPSDRNVRGPRRSFTRRGRRHRWTTTERTSSVARRQGRASSRGPHGR